MESSVRHQSTAAHDGKKTLETLNLDNLALRSLPIDPVSNNFPREVRPAVHFMMVLKAIFRLFLTTRRFPTPASRGLCPHLCRTPSPLG
jgi:hypothetical protein